MSLWFLLFFAGARTRVGNVFTAPTGKQHKASNSGPGQAAHQELPATRPAFLPPQGPVFVWFPSRLRTVATGDSFKLALAWFLASSFIFDVYFLLQISSCVSRWKVSWTCLRSGGRLFCSGLRGMCYWRRWNPLRINPDALICGCHIKHKLFLLSTWSACLWLRRGGLNWLGRAVQTRQSKPQSDKTQTQLPLFFAHTSNIKQHAEAVSVANKNQRRSLFF